MRCRVEKVCWRTQVRMAWLPEADTPKERTPLRAVV